MKIDLLKVSACFAICTLVLSVKGKEEAGRCKELQFLLSARDLPKMDVGNGKPDPYIGIRYYRNVDLLEDAKSFKPKKYAYQTATINNNHNPDWPEVLLINCTEDIMQYKLQFTVVDEDVSDDDEIGTVTTTMKELFSGKTLTKDIVGIELGKRGRLIIYTMINGTVSDRDPRFGNSDVEVIDLTKRIKERGNFVKIKKGKKHHAGSESDETIEPEFFLKSLPQ